MNKPAVTIITPSYNRPHLLALQQRTVLAQTEQDFEWLILDDSPEPNPHFRELHDPRIRYHHHDDGRMSVGAKRNWLAERAQAPVIAHFDDDDYYAPHYLAAMLARLAQGGDLVKLSAYFIWAGARGMLGYWDMTQIHKLHYQISQSGVLALNPDEKLTRQFENLHPGYGFSYVYRRSVWLKDRFPDKDFGEDWDFVNLAMQRGPMLDHFADETGLCLHILRKDNMSASYPQYLFPGFVVGRIFGPDVLPLLA